MEEKTKGLKKYAEQKSKLAYEKVDRAIRELSLKNDKINFNSVATLSGVSKTFLYNNQEIKKRIEDLRQKQVNEEMNRKVKYDKTARSKDIIIVAKNKRIRELEEENKRLKEQLEILRGRIYSMI